MSGKFIISNSRDKQFYFNLKAENGEPILTSETYKTKQGAENGIASVRTNSKINDNFKRWKKTDGSFYFTLIAENGEPIGKSEIYNTQQGMEKGVSSVKENAPFATVVDNT